MLRSLRCTAWADGAGAEGKVLTSGPAPLSLGLQRQSSIVLSIWTLDSRLCTSEPQVYHLSATMILDEFLNLPLLHLLAALVLHVFNCILLILSSAMGIQIAFDTQLKQTMLP